MSQRARRGSGHLYRRGKVWWFKFFDAQGQPHWRSSGSREHAVAETVGDLGRPVVHSLSLQRSGVTSSEASRNPVGLPDFKSGGPF